MNLTTLPSTVKTLPVGATTIAKTAMPSTVNVGSGVVVPTSSSAGLPVVNTQSLGAHPDGSGKKVTQFEALVGNASVCYANTGLAERACIQAAQAAGLNNYSVVTSSPIVFQLAAW